MDVGSSFSRTDIVLHSRYWAQLSGFCCLQRAINDMQQFCAVGNTQLARQNLFAVALCALDTAKTAQLQT
jgi:hypothetical protein